MDTNPDDDLQSLEQGRAAKAERNKLSRDTDEADFKWLMGSKRGRRITWRLLERARVFHPSFNTNAMAMSFAEGQKNEGLRTLDKIHTLCPEIYSVMLKEALHDTRSTDA